MCPIYLKTRKYLEHYERYGKMFQTNVTRCTCHTNIYFILESSMKAIFLDENYIFHINHYRDIKFQL